MIPSEHPGTQKVANDQGVEITLYKLFPRSFVGVVVLQSNRNCRLARLFLFAQIAKILNMRPFRSL